MPVAQQDNPVAQQGEAIAVPVAARRLGRSPDEIRSAIRRGKLSARKGNDGEWLVFLPPTATADQPVEADELALLVDRLRAEPEQERRLSADRAETVATCVSVSPGLRARLPATEAGSPICTTLSLISPAGWTRRQPSLPRLAATCSSG